MISSFALLVGIPIGIMNPTIGLKIYALTAGIKKYKSIIKKPYSRWASSELLTDGGVAKRPPLPKICHTYLTKMKLDTIIPHTKEIQKIYESHDTPLEFC